MDNGFVAQVGGAHYQSEYQHWDWAIDIRLGYLESAATKYITRWKGKNGVQDVEKGISYLKKAQAGFLAQSLTVQGMPRYSNTCLMLNRGLAEQARELTDRFMKLNGLTVVEREFMLTVVRWRNYNDLDDAIRVAKLILEMANNAAQLGDVPQAAQGAGQATAGAQQAHSLPQQAAGGTPAPRFTSSRSVGIINRVNHPVPYGYQGDGDE